MRAAGLALSLLAACSFPRPADVPGPADAAGGETADAAESGLDAEPDGIPDAEPDGIPDARPDGIPDGEPDARPDARPDAQPPVLESVDTEVRIAAGETTFVTLHIQSVAPTVTWSISSSDTFQPSTDTVPIPGTRRASAVVAYRAPTTSGDRSHSVTLTSSENASRTFSFITAVRVLALLGQGQRAGDLGLSLVGDLLYGQAILVPRPTFAMRIGLFAQSGGFQGRLALYRDAGGVPRDLVFATPPIVIQPGKNEWTVSPASLPAGTYWLLGNFGSNAAIQRDPAIVPQAFITHSVGDILPTSLGGVQTTSHQSLSYYLLVAD